MAVVAVENKETWKWFLDLLLDDIEMGIGHGLTLISDQHKVYFCFVLFKLNVFVMSSISCFLSGINRGCQRKGSSSRA